METYMQALLAVAATFGVGLLGICFLALAMMLYNDFFKGRK